MFEDLYWIRWWDFVVGCEALLAAVERERLSEEEGFHLKQFMWLHMSFWKNSLFSLNDISLLIG